MKPKKSNPTAETLEEPYAPYTTPLCCKSCGVPYGKHLGFNGSCAALQEALRVLRQLAATESVRSARGVAGAAVAFIESQIGGGK
jgi:hypothetical protein